MKKVLLLTIVLLLGLTSFSQINVQNFKVTSPINQSFTFGDRFDYEFEIQGNYGYNEIKLSVYVESVTSNNLIGFIRWNREGDDYLSFGSYTKKDMWLNTFYLWNNRSFTTSPTKKFYLVVEYQGATKTLQYTIPGSAGEPDLVIDTNKSTTIVPGSGNSTVSLSTNNIESIYLNEELQFYLEIKNTGEVSSGSFKVGFYLSHYNDISNSSLVKEEEFGKVSAKSKKSKTINISQWDLNSFVRADGYGYVHIKVDIDDEVDEKNESNNSFSSRKIKVYDKQRSVAGTFPKIIYSMFQSSTPVNITVNNEHEEKNAFRNLNRGMYIIKDSIGNKSKLQVY